jgi:hypothetical protein
MLVDEVGYVVVVCFGSLTFYVTMLLTLLLFSLLTLLFMQM